MLQSPVLLHRAVGTGPVGCTTALQPQQLPHTQLRRPADLSGALRCMQHRSLCMRAQSHTRITCGWT